jgi:hypothetical protein
MMDPILLLQSIPGVGPYLPYVALAVTICAAIATVAPGPKATGWTNSALYRGVYAILQWCALNKGHATALSSPAATGIVGGGGAISDPQVSTASVPKGPTS